MARKPNTESAKLLEVRNDKIDQLSQIADQIQHLRDTAAHIQSDIEKLDFALTVLDPSHVPMDAQSSTSGRLLIEAQPHKVDEPQPVEAQASQTSTTAVEEVAAPKRGARAARKNKAKKTVAAKAGRPVAAKKAAGTRKAKSEPIPQTAVDAAEKLTDAAPSSSNEKVARARSVVNAYVADIKPADEIEAILKKAPKRGLTVDAITEALIKSRPLEGAQGEVLMKLKNRISSNIAHMMKKGIVGKGKPEGESLTHYYFQKKGKATPSRAKSEATPTTAPEAVTEAVETPAETPAEQVA